MTLTVGLVAMATLAATPSANAGSCDDYTNWGTDWHYNSCTFDCGIGTNLITYSDSSQSNYVDAHAQCGGATAGCSDSDGYCYAYSSGLTTSTSHSSSNCWGSTYVPWTTPGGVMHTSCYTNTNQQALTRLIAQYVDGAGASSADGPCAKAVQTLAESAPEGQGVTVVTSYDALGATAVAYAWSASGCSVLAARCTVGPVSALLSPDGLGGRAIECGL
jgi:hypothetical protein